MKDWSRNFNSSCLNKQSALWQNFSKICKHIHPFILFLVGDHIKRCHKLFVDKSISLLSYLVQNADGFSPLQERKAFVFGNQDGRRYDVSWKPTIGHFSVVCSVPWPLNRSKDGGDLVLLQTFLLFMCKAWYSHANKPGNMIIYICVTATVKISRSEKVYNRRENISCCEKFQSPWKSSTPWKSYCLWRKSAHTDETFYFSTHSLIIYNANFRDLVLVCISHSRSNYQYWKLHVIHCYLIIATFFLLNMLIQIFFFPIVKQFFYHNEM